MASEIDSSIGFAPESTWGTAVTPTKFPEFLSETMEWKPDFIKSVGFRPGSRVQRYERVVLGKNRVEGDIDLEVVTKGVGFLFNALLGNGVSTILGTGPGYQQNFTFGNLPIPYTIQKGIPLLGSGVVQPFTYAGAIVTKGNLKAAEGDTVKLKTSWNAKSVTTATAYAAPSYIPSNEVFNFTQGAITIGGTLTMPTTTTLASGGTNAADVRDFDLTIDNKLDVSGYTFGAGGQQGRMGVVGGPASVAGKMTVEFDNTTLRDAYLNQTPLGVVLTFTSATVITTGINPVLQIVMPAIKITQLPILATMGVVKQTVTFEVLDNAVNAPITVILRTTDTAI